MSAIEDDMHNKTAWFLSDAVHDKLCPRMENTEDFFEDYIHHLNEYLRGIWLLE